MTHRGASGQQETAGKRSAPALGVTAALIGRAKSGDAEAREQLMARYLPILTRWAHGRLPENARSLSETSDLVQVTLTRAMMRLETFEPRGEGAFLAYLWRTLMNQLRNEIRRSAHGAERPSHREIPDGRPSLLEQLIARDVVAAYEAGLATLPERMQEAIILHVEFGYRHRELAEAIGSPSPNAARMLVTRALARLAKAMEQCG
jgi:RNA polymerase sigma factor (sigma-70 family)